jgi:predicted phosphodiesterase
MSHNRKWVGPRLWYLLNLEPWELRIIFPDQTWDNLKNKRKLYRKRIKEGKEVAPRRPRDYERGEAPEQIRDRLHAAPVVGELAVNQLIDQESREKLHKLLDEVIDQANINPAMIKGFRVSQWDGHSKDNEGNPQVTKLRGINFIAEAKDFQPKWPVIQRAESKIYPVKTKERKVEPGQYQKAVILPDPQIGYLRYSDGSIEAMHDEKAIEVALQIIKDVKPDKVICLGDYLDLAEFSRYEQSPEFAFTSQLAIDYGHKLLATIRATLPYSEIAVIEGNHDARLAKKLKANAMAAFGLRRAEDTTGWPVLSPPYLMAFDQLGVEYVEGYPAGKYWINERLQLIHGHIVRSNGSTAAALAKQENVSTITGHIHRIEAHYDTQNIYKGGRTNAAFSPGCLCRIDGAVPSAKGGNRLDGRPVRNFENWAQGLAVVNYETGDGPFHYEQIYINTFENYRTMYRGKVYTP